MALFNWKLHGDGKTIKAGEAIAPDERLSWPRTCGIGLQHIVAMFGATFLVPIITGFPPATTLFFSAISTMLFLLITRNRVPSYLGSSFAFLAPVIAASSGGSFGVATFGILCTGVLLALVGLLVMKVGTGWVNKLMPPVVTGVIVALIGFNLAPEALKNFIVSPVTACVTFGAIVLLQALSKGMLGRLSILLGVLIGYVCAVIRQEVDFASIGSADWVGLPSFTAPIPEWGILPMFLPVVLVLIAENIGHVKSVATMTGKNLDGSIGHALFSDGLGTALSGLGGGSGTTTYAENIGVMAATRVYSTAAYWVAGLGALVLSLCPKFGAAVASVPAGVLGGVCILLYGMIGMLGVRIWVENHVDFSKPLNIITTAVPMVLAIANLSISFGASVETNVNIQNLLFTSHGVVDGVTGLPVAAPADAITLGAIAVGSLVALLLYHLVYALQKLRGIDTGD
ncbi:MAG: nitrate reductase [Coriobacteriales bacterium]|jgi:uracil-xanthine permease|nr:nitrate reductase [Coriobacteriales bacterium]